MSCVHPPEEQPTILYFGNDWFAENRTSSHHIARWLAERFPVHYIECPGLRAPEGSGRDLKKIVAKLTRALRGARIVDSGVKVRTLLQIPLHRLAVVRRLNRSLIFWTLRWHLWREKVKRPITWFLVPHLAPVAGRLGERLSVYYCIDDYAALPGVDPDAVRQMDEELTRKADLVFVASQTLEETKRRLNPNTFVSPHGVDVAHFAKAQNAELSIPEDVRGLRGPVVGFFGLIERWIDLDLVDYLALQRPEWTFLLIGRVAVGPEKVPRRPNVHLIGKRPYEQLPAYGRLFDASIIPYHLTQQVLHANPLKLREYLAMGKPVVSVSTPETDKFADVVELAHSREEFLARLDKVLSRPSSAEEVRKRMQRVASQSWDGRLREVLEIVMSHCSEPGKRSDSAAVIDRAGLAPNPAGCAGE